MNLPTRVTLALEWPLAVVLVFVFLFAFAMMFVALGASAGLGAVATLLCTFFAAPRAHDLLMRILHRGQ